MRPKPARKGFIENPFESKQPGQALGTHDSIELADKVVSSSPIEFLLVRAKALTRRSNFM
ncbi:MAG: hypothetical protein US49_C0009G0029 [candidate division TM6 bacterium GW2011_GWF2_37_49]|nr:MAG: hypothetical protein US49_C0009G0029 [candidate division TM6 bacterium GW2011_GWF2_37_49]